MLLFIAKKVIAVLLVSFASWISGKRPDVAGFIKGGQVLS